MFRCMSRSLLCGWIEGSQGSHESCEDEDYGSVGPGLHIVWKCSGGMMRAFVVEGGHGWSWYVG